MKQRFALFLLMSIFNSLQSCSQALSICKKSPGQNFFQFRSMSSYSTPEILALKTLYQTDYFSRQYWQGTLSVMPQYMQNINDGSLSGKNISSYPFWSGSNVLSYGGNNGQTDVDAYQFGVGDLLNTGYLTLNTQIRQIGADIIFHMVHNKNHPSPYFTIRAPVGSNLVQTKLYDTHPLHNEIANAQTCATWLYYPTLNNRFPSLSQAFKAGSISFGTGLHPESGPLYIDSPLNKPFSLNSGRISENQQEVFRIADIAIAAGYQCIATENGFFSIGALFTCPTGNLPTGQYIFEPIFGRAGYWGLGLETMAHASLWQHPRRDRGVDFWMRAELLHLIAGRKPNMRSLDLAQNGPGSRYLLLQKYHQALPSPQNPSGSIASYITQAINITTVPVNSKFDFEGNCAFLFDFHEGNCNGAISIEVWGRSQESLYLDAYHLLHLNAANLSEFVVLGRQVSSDARSWLLDPTKLILTLDLCEPKAQINKSVDRVDGVGIPPAQLTYPTNLPKGVMSAHDPASRIPADLNKALDIAGAQAPAALTIKMNGQLGYTHKTHKLTPQCSIVAGIEINPENNNHAINQWSAGVQCSLNF